MLKSLDNVGRLTWATHIKHRRHWCVH